MEKSRTAAYLTCIALVVLTGLVIAQSNQVRFNGTWAESLDLPIALDPYDVVVPRYCTNDVCLSRFSLSELSDPNVCPDCSGTLSDRALSEVIYLPADTRMEKRLYTAPDDASYFVTLVIGGVEKDSIHKPQVCLIGQGNQILEQAVETIELGGGRQVDVTMLELSYPPSPGADDEYRRSGTYAYWFYRDGEETAYHLERTLATMLDGALKNEWKPWSYITISTASEPDREKRRHRARAFIRDFYPTFLEVADQ